MGRDGGWERIADLVGKARGGDEESFRELLGSHRAVVTSTLLACGVRTSDTAQDLAQEVALRAWAGLDRLEDPRAFTAWLRRIAANAARDHLRRRAVRREDELEHALDLAASDDPHRAAERTAEIRLMLAALAAEDAEIAELLVARAEGVSVAELAARSGLTEGALKMRLSRARGRLRERLDDLRRGRA